MVRTLHLETTQDGAWNCEERRGGKAVSILWVRDCFASLAMTCQSVVLRWSASDEAEPESRRGAGLLGAGEVFEVLFDLGGVEAVRIQTEEACEHVAGLR